MDDTISRQMAIDALIRKKGPINNGDGTMTITPLTDTVIKDVLGNLPSAESKIIRCKDCKHSDPWYRDKRRCFLWSDNGIDVFDDGFCNYAERRIHEED